MSSEHVVVPEQVNMNINHRSLIERKKKEILSIASQYGAYNIRICGSVARGEDSLARDIDLLVDMEQGKSLLDLSGFLMDLQTSLDAR